MLADASAGGGTAVGPRQSGEKVVNAGTSSRAVRVALAKLSTFEGWQFAVQAWNEVKATSIRIVLLMSL